MAQVKHRITVIASTDDAGKQIDFERLDEVLTTVTRSSQTKLVSQTRSIAAAAADEALAFGDITTASMLYIESDQALTFKLNGGSEVFKLEPTSGAKAKLLWEGEFTAISVTNPSADTVANISYFLATTES